jgi:DNA helicase II / ATP-dependent DNA helicase PcrA
MPSTPDKKIILAAAGSRKTERIVDSALAASGGRVLIATFTSENQRRIVERIEQKRGTVPGHVSVVGWFSFLISQCAKPYQRTITGAPLVITGLNFKGQRSLSVNKTNPRYFIDRGGALYRNGVADFVTCLEERTGGAVVSRLERIYAHILIDEFQDLCGYDLEVFERLLKSRINLLAVGDVRQSILDTNTSPKHKKYRGCGLYKWFEERSELCQLETMCDSYRCNQAICDFGDALFPALPPTHAVEVPTTSHDGIFVVCRADVPAYVRQWPSVTVLRHDKRADTCNLPATNIGLAKGSTCDRVLLFPTKPILEYLKKRNPAALKEPERLYVAVTRARFSTTFVIPDGWQWGGTQAGVCRWRPDA